MSKVSFGGRSSGGDLAGGAELLRLVAEFDDDTPSTAGQFAAMTMTDGPLAGDEEWLAAQIGSRLAVIPMSGALLFGLATADAGDAASSLNEREIPELPDATIRHFLGHDDDNNLLIGSSAASTPISVKIYVVNQVGSRGRTGPAGATGPSGTPRTGAEVVTLLQALTGNARLNATALRLIADALDTELGSTDWRTGGGGGSPDTAAQILAKLLTVDGAGSGLDADLLDGMTPAQVAALGGGGSSAYYPIDNSDVGGSANGITLTTGRSLTALTGGMLFFFNSTNTNTGATTINVDGIGVRNLQRSRPRGEGANINTGSEPLEGGEITNSDPVMVVYGSQFNEFYLLPSRAGTAAYRNIGTAQYDVPSLGAGGDLALGVIPAGIARLAGAVFTGVASGITPTDDAHFATKAYVDSLVSGGGMATDDIYWGTSDDATPQGSEATVAAVNGAGTIPAYVGDKHIIVARLATEDDFTRIVRSDDVSQTNQLGAFTKFASTVVPTGETLAFNVWVSNQALSQAADVIWTAS